MARRDLLILALPLILACAVSGAFPVPTPDLQNVTGDKIQPQNQLQATETPCFLVVSVSRLNLRNSPMGATDPDGLYQGDRLAVLAERGGWLQVTTSDGRTGWVDADYVDLECR